MSDNRQQSGGIEVMGGSESDMEILKSIDLNKGFLEQIDKMKVLGKHLENVIVKIKEKNDRIKIANLTQRQVIRMSNSVQLSRVEQKAILILQRSLNKKLDKKFGADTVWEKLLTQAKAKATPTQLAALRQSVAQVSTEARESIDAAEAVSPGILAISAAASSVPEKDRNIEYTEKLLKLKGNVEPAKQLEEISYMQSQITSIIAKLKKKNEKIDVTKIRPEILAALVNKEQVPLILSERVALEEFIRVISEAGPTSEFLKNSWPDVIGNAEEASKGWTDKIKERFKKDPVGTTALLVAGAAGLYLGFELIYSLIKGKEGGGDKEKKSGFFSAKMKRILLGIGAIITGSVIGRDQLKSLLGLDRLDEIKDALEKGKDIPKTARKQLEKRAAELESAEAKVTEATKKTGVAGAIEKAKTKISETTEKRKTHKKYCEFIKSQNPELDINPELLGLVSSMSYEEFLEISRKGKLELLYTFYMKFVQSKEKVKNRDEWLEAVKGLGVWKLGEFFEEMLKNPDHKDFKGKTINEVLDLITNEKDKYVDPEKVAEALKKPEYIKEFYSLFDEIKKDPKIVHDKEFRDKFYHASIKAGVMVSITHAGEVLLLLAKNSIPVARFVGSEVTRAIHYMAGKFKEEGGVVGYAAWGYFEAVGYAAGIGVPAFMLKRILKDSIHRPGTLINPLRIGWSSIKGGYEGLKWSLFMPAKTAWLGTKSAYKYIMPPHVTPLKEAKRALYQKMFMLEEVKLTRVGKWIGKTKMGKATGMKSIILEAIEGNIQITPGLMKRLHIYRNMLEAESGLLKRNVRSELSEVRSGEYDEIVKKIDKLEKKVGWSTSKPNKINEKYAQGKKPDAVPRLNFEEYIESKKPSELKQELKKFKKNFKKMKKGPEKMATLKKIQALESFLNPEMATKTVSKLSGIDELSDIIKVERLEVAAAQLEANAIGINAHIKQRASDIEKRAKAKGVPINDVEFKSEMRELDELIEKYAKQRAGDLNRISKEYKKLPKNLRTPKLKSQIKLAFQEPGETFLTRFKKVGSTRLKLGVVIAATMFSIEAFTNDDPEKEWHEMLEEFGPMAGQIMVDISPVIGTYSMFHSAISGEELISDRKLNTTDRLINAGFGVASLAADVLTVIATVGGVGIGGGVVGGIATTGRLAVLAKKGGKIGRVANRILSAWPRISALMSRMGVKKFAESTARYMKGEKALKTLIRAEKVASRGAMALMGGALAYSFIGGHEVDIPEGIEIAGVTPQASGKSM